jgi:hypothetical protein
MSPPISALLPIGALATALRRMPARVTGALAKGGVVADRLIRAFRAGVAATTFAAAATWTARTVFAGTVALGARVATIEVFAATRFGWPCRFGVLGRGVAFVAVRVRLTHGVCLRPRSTRYTSSPGRGGTKRFGHVRVCLMI